MCHAITVEVAPRIYAEQFGEMLIVSDSSSGCRRCGPVTFASVDDVDSHTEAGQAPGVFVVGGRSPTASHDSMA